MSPNGAHWKPIEAFLIELVLASSGQTPITKLLLFLSNGNSIASIRARYVTQLGSRSKLRRGALLSARLVQDLWPLGGSGAMSSSQTRQESRVFGLRWAEIARGAPKSEMESFYGATVWPNRAAPLVELSQLNEIIMKEEERENIHHFRFLKLLSVSVG